jgi:hypothetical protein
MTPASVHAGSWDGRISRPCRPTRGPAGLAAIEFVMALTVILFLLVALLWIGRVAANSVQATVAARHAAWTRRPQARPRSFDFTDLEGGRVRGAATVPVSVSPLFDGMILPRSEQTILGGSWDHRRERLSRSPNRRLYPVLLRQALAAGAADGAALEGLLGSLANQIKDGIAEELAGNEILREIEQTRQELEDRVRQAQEKLDEVKQQVQEEVAAIVRRFEEARDRARLAVQAIDRELEALERRIKEHAAVEPKDGDHQADTGRLERQLEDRRRAGREAVEQLRRLESLLEKARSATGL